MIQRGDTDRIRQLLEQCKNGLTIDEVARHLGINRSTASKYLNLLVSTGVATIRKLGPAKLFYLKERVPIHQLLDCVPEGIVIVDAAFFIQHINGILSSFFGIDGGSLVGSVVFDTPLSPLFDTETTQAIEDIPSKQGAVIRGTVVIGGKTMDIQKRVIPVQFESGTAGYCLICHFEEGLEARQVIGEDKIHPEMTLYDQFFKLDALFRRYTKNRVTIALEILKKVMENRETDRVQELMKEQEEILQALLVHIRIFDEFLDDTSPRLGWYALEEVVGNALSLVRLSHIRFFSDIRGVEIFSDRSICRVFQTLLENSVVHGKKVTSIRVTARESPDGLSIVYEDDGIGIPDSEKSTLFEWGRGMHRAHSLFLCRQVLAATGISIRENGVFNRGARFEILVPPEKYRIRTEYQR